MWKKIFGRSWYIQEMSMPETGRKRKRCRWCYQTGNGAISLNGHCKNHGKSRSCRKPIKIITWRVFLLLLVSKLRLNPYCVSLKKTEPRQLGVIFHLNSCVYNNLILVLKFSVLFMMIIKQQDGMYMLYFYKCSIKDNRL